MTLANSPARVAAVGGSAAEPLRVLVLHNRYRQRGGEDAVVDSEIALLRSNGVDVEQYSVENWADGSKWLAGEARLGWSGAYSARSYEEVRRICDRFRPDVAHVHNFWMRLSPSVHAACRQGGAAAVQTLHNFRLVCVNGILRREGRTCEDCIGRWPWRGVLRGCYRKSILASAAVARMIVVNRRRKTWERDVDALIALTEFSRSRVMSAGVGRASVFVKPNFVEAPTWPAAPPSRCDGVVYAGRLSEEKGVSILVRAWGKGALSDFGRLVIIGEGSARASLERLAGTSGCERGRICFTGTQPADQVLRSIGAARVVCAPSLCFEGFPRLVVEAFACGRPVVASNLGGLAEIVGDGREGLLFPPGDELALSQAIRALLTDGMRADELGANARETHRRWYGPEENFKALMSIYRFAIEHRGRPIPRVLAGFDRPAFRTIAGDERSRDAGSRTSLASDRADVVRAATERCGHAGERVIG